MDVDASMMSGITGGAEASMLDASTFQEASEARDGGAAAEMDGAEGSGGTAKKLKTDGGNVDDAEPSDAETIPEEEEAQEEEEEDEPVEDEEEDEDEAERNDNGVDERVEERDGLDEGRLAREDEDEALDSDDDDRD
jgi:hypothetical protein